MRRISSREMRRLMRRLGLNMQELPEAKEVRIIFTNGEVLVFDNPKVLKLMVPGMEIYQIIGEARKETLEQLEQKEKEEKEAVEVSEEDIMLVAQQAGVSYEEAKKALIETKGDLAQAIMLLTSRKKG